ncbi:MAG: FTR1 family protein, partial [Anaerolineae bacterium]|nr:FTR1 family protein [Anaerolineae bacterium]
WALFGVAFLAVVREGLELALLLVATSLQNPAFATLVGALIGLAAATLLGVLLYRGVVRLNLRLFFAVTNVLLLLFAAGMVGLGIHELVEAGIAPAIVEPVYDINPFFSDQSLAGEMLKSLFGFNGNPALSEALAYIAYLVAASWYLFGPAQRRPATPAALTGR